MASAESERRPGRLLLVDDEPNILRSLQRLFRPEGYEIVTAESAEAGLERLAEEEVDLIISDMRMPGMNGAEFLQRVADRWPHIVRILLTGYADLQATINAINHGHIYSYFSKPWEDHEIRLAVRHALEQKRLHEERKRLQALTERQNRELKGLNAELSDLNATLEQRVQARTEELRQTNLFLELAYGQLEESYFSAIPIFASMVQLREGPRGGHGRRVSELAFEVAQRLGLEPDEARDVRFAGLLHDVGKLGFPDALLRKPCAILTSSERKVVEKHAVTGQAVLMGLEPLQRVARFIRSHHERLDGNGYPDRLSGSAIPLGARILAAVNDYDNLCTGMLIERTLEPEEAQSFLRERRGSRYDAEVIDVLSAILAERTNREARRRERHLTPGMLLSEMVLSQDLLSPDGLLLLARGHRLTQVLIEKISRYAREQKSDLTISVWEEEDDAQTDVG